MAMAASLRSGKKKHASRDEAATIVVRCEDFEFFANRQKDKNFDERLGRPRS
jgi:hypothetical protein